MSGTLEAVANLFEPVALQAPPACERLESRVAFNSIPDEAASRSVRTTQPF